MRWLNGLVAAAVIAATATIATAQEPEGEQPMSVWMKRKLEASQHTLEALALEDYDMIRKSAESMYNMSRLEGLVRRRDTADYRTQLRIFRDANQQLMTAADDHNLDAAALAFTQLTLSCVNCHKQLRNAEK
ncbi:MAG: hypothetical protein K1X74_07000 [Pirellulales bacterium]|nr:hypothetical protein [Pirellulales bacterium]